MALFVIFGFMRITKQQIILLILSLLLTFVYGGVNYLHDNYLKDFFFSTIIGDSLIFFLTLGAFLNIFMNFSLRKEMKKKDVEKITESKIDSSIEEEKTNKIIEDISTIGG